MRVFEFEIEVDYGNCKKREVYRVFSKHLNGAIKRLYQEIEQPFELKKIM